MNLKRCPHCHRSLRGTYKDSISTLLKGLGITKTKFAEDLGTSRWLVHQWINGKVNPGQEYIQELRKSTISLYDQATHRKQVRASITRQLNERRRRAGLGPLPEEPRTYIPTESPEITITPAGMGAFHRLVNSFREATSGGK